MSIHSWTSLKDLLMSAITDNTTIAAISTPPGTGGISVIRISGENAVEIADKVFSSKSLKTAKSHTVHYGFIKDKNGETIDEVLLSVMLAPKTFTREDTVEISCHGGSVSTHAVLRAVIEAGAHMAGPGEFTKRAFMNGRIDLSQAEAVIDIINSKNELAQRNAISQLGGSLSKEIESVRDELVHLSARMQVIIDYPDEDLEDVDKTVRSALSFCTVSHADDVIRCAIDLSNYCRCKEEKETKTYSTVVEEAANKGKLRGIRQ